VKTNLRIWVIGSVVAMVALLAGGWLVGAQPFLTAASAASASASQIAMTNQSTQSRLARLAKQASDIRGLKSQEAVATAAVPASLDSNAFVARINAIAATVHVSVQSVTPGTPQAYTEPASVQAAQQAATIATQPSASPSASASAAPAPAAAPVPALAATDPSISGANFTVVPMTVAVKGTMEATLQFTHALQHDQRLFLVSGYTLAAGESGGHTVTATLTGYIYALTH
jgi:hypothetical protein